MRRIIYKGSGNQNFEETIKEIKKNKLEIFHFEIETFHKPKKIKE